jgi:hypothetical protein
MALVLRTRPDTPCFAGASQLVVHRAQLSATQLKPVQHAATENKGINSTVVREISYKQQRLQPGLVTQTETIPEKY